MKKIGLILMICLCGCFCLAGCGGGQIEQDIKSQIDGVINVNEQVISDIEKKGIKELSNFEVVTDDVITTILNEVSVDISVEEKEKTAVATITVTRLDLTAAIDLLAEKATEFRDSDKVNDMEKADRYQTGKDDLNQALEATANTSAKVIIEYTKNNEEWVANDNVYSKVINAVITEKEAKQLVEVYKKGYGWIFDDKNASQIAEILKHKGLNIGEIQAFDEETDPGEMLGRPGGYLSKVNFFDKKLQKNVESYILKHDGVINYSYGGTIEVFETAELAKNRGDYLENLSVTTMANKYYTYRFCNVVLRVGDAATPTKAQKYADVFFDN